MGVWGTEPSISFSPCVEHFLRVLTSEADLGQGDFEYKLLLPWALIEVRLFNQA